MRLSSNGCIVSVCQIAQIIVYGLHLHVLPYRQRVLFCFRLIFLLLFTYLITKLARILFVETPENFPSGDSTPVTSATLPWNSKAAWQFKLSLYLCVKIIHLKVKVIVKCGTNDSLVTAKQLFFLKNPLGNVTYVTNNTQEISTETASCLFSQRQSQD